MADKNRVRIFVDFWNLQLNWNDHHARAAGAAGRVQIPWKDILPTVLTTEASKGQPAKFAGAHVYASINPSSKKDRSLSDWMHHVLASFAGYSIEVKDRKPRKTIHCQEEACRAEVTSCPACKSPLKGTVEKGIDAAIITDLISLAFDDTCRPPYSNWESVLGQTVRIVHGCAKYGPVTCSAHFRALVLWRAINRALWDWPCSSALVCRRMKSG